MRTVLRSLAVVLVTAVVLTGGWLLYRYGYPVPPALAGVWENETKLISAGPGEVRLIISRGGTVAVEFDRQKYEWWGLEKPLHIRVSGDTAEVWSDPDRKVRLRVEVRGGRMTVSDPERLPKRPDDVAVFRRVEAP